MSSHTVPIASASFDDPNLIGTTGVVPMMKLAENASLVTLAGEMCVKRLLVLRGERL